MENISRGINFTSRCFSFILGKNPDGMRIVDRRYIRKKDERNTEEKIFIF